MIVKYKYNDSSGGSPVERRTLFKIIRSREYSSEVRINEQRNILKERVYKLIIKSGI